MNYSFSGNKRKGLKKPFKVLIIIAVIMAAAVYFIGVTLGSGSEQRQAVSQAIEENRMLKNEITAKDKQINDLEYEVRVLREELASIPTPSPTPYVPEQPEEPSEILEEERSPRE